LQNLIVRITSKSLHKMGC